MVCSVVSYGSGNATAGVEDWVFASAWESHPVGRSVNEVSESDHIAARSSAWASVSWQGFGADVFRVVAVGKTVVPLLFNREGFHVGHDADEPGRLATATIVRVWVTGARLVAGGWIAFVG